VTFLLRERPISPRQGPSVQNRHFSPELPLLKPRLNTLTRSLSVSPRVGYWRCRTRWRTSRDCTYIAKHKRRPLAALLTRHVSSIAGFQLGHRGYQRHLRVRESHLADSSSTIDERVGSSISIACWVVVFSPQIVENFKRGSADGLSLQFIIIWLAGDVFNILGAVLQGVLPTMVIINA
jgi:hypothetical protein